MAAIPAATFAEIVAEEAFVTAPSGRAPVVEPATVLER